MLDKDAANAALEKALAASEQATVQIKAAMTRVYCSDKFRGDMHHHLISAATYADTSYHHVQKAFLIAMKRSDDA
jgi:hypothetical protein